ncbi:Ig-like domain-containing protein [Winogradskyella alexanderae]|uniref:Ig-like domain-containing protein n=1 Tax=Winogradskyella alexanderae TaxID=2877123 RepID=A0ABS7XPX2_9FLAO|nr:Ig-like domain-containing protein [Winogradskyella alexanderae]MCA0131498.1 Ig-like domain-containing protein [Winogradskyella alexanderae]
MYSTLQRIFIGLFFIALIASCANRGSPSGGEKDTEPPIILKSEPENFSTNFTGDEIKIYFDEYVKIKDLRRQLIISPPMDTEPTIIPMGGASKYISIKINDTLKSNTTYAFNFGESIVDNNEENPYPYYRYVFSTGETIDSLSVTGYVEDALLEKPDEYITVMLYEVDSSYSDSLVFKEKPRYVTNTLDSLTTFRIDNIKAGTYKLLALKDKNSNFIFDQKNDKIAFKNEFVTIPSDTSHRLTLFKEELNFKAFSTKQDGEYRIMFPYEGNYKTMKIELLGDKPEGFEHRITKDKQADTLYYWYKPKIEIDTVLFEITNEKYVDTVKHRFRALETDSLTIRAVNSGTLNFDQDFSLDGNIPFVKIDKSKISLIKKDSSSADFEVEYDSLLNKYTFPVEKEEGQSYVFTMLPETFEDFYGGVNKDTLNFSFRTKMKSEFGNLRVQLRNAEYPLIVQLVNNNGVVIYERYTTGNPVVDFRDVAPRKYALRVIYDTNANGKYDTGNYLLGIQPERVSYAPSEDVEEIRASFDFVIDFTLLD